MQPTSIQNILSTIHVPIDDPSFFNSIYHYVVEERKHTLAKDGDNLRRVCAEEYEEISLRLDSTQVQDSCSVRNVLRTRRMANLLINDKGEINLSLLPLLIEHLKTHFYPWGANRQVDLPRHRHVLKVLTGLLDNKEHQRLLRQISKPYLHPVADQIIRDTLQLPQNAIVTDAHARRAALSAWLCFLRQNVGSCFATAPAIIVQSEQPELFLLDLHELISTGRLKRTFEGVEYVVPLINNWGSGDLRRGVLLSLHSKESPADVWHAPGLQIALEETGLLDIELDNTEKIKQIHEKIVQAFPDWNEKNPMIITNVETILKRIFMIHTGVNENDLTEYALRPKGMIYSGLMMQTSTLNSGMGGKGEACANFHHFMEIGSNSFKALSENALLKSWEYSLASFSETKSEFTRWNLYSSLGLAPNDAGGIGQCLHTIIKEKLDRYNQKVSDLQFEYEHMFAQVKQLEVRIRNAASEQEAQWVRAEYQVKSNEFYLLEELRDAANSKAQVYANLFNIIIDHYDQLFPEHFQEVYDPDIREVQTGPYDDSPAGYRLLFKHGRSNTSQWTPLKSPQEFIDALSRFFTITERELSSIEPLKGLENDISDIVTSVVTHIKTNEFLESAFYRMAVAHKVAPMADPLDNLDKISMKPWAYISGGTMTTLVSCYFKRDQKPTEVARWVDSPTELLVYFVDTIKQIPPMLVEPFIKDQDKSLLIHSPTHAFLLKPGISPFKEAWQSEAFSYTWVRDQLIKPMERFVDTLELDEGMQEYLINHLVQFVPINFQPYFRQSFSRMIGKMDAADFRDYVLDGVNKERGLRYQGSGVLSSVDMDSALYNLLPLFSANELGTRLINLIEQNPQVDQKLKQELKNAILDKTQSIYSNNYINAQQLQEICHGLLCAAYGSTSLPFDCPGAINRTAQKLGYAMPGPIIFADTNWVRDYFAFVVSPGTKLLELWRVDPSGRNGSPMTAWKEWVNGSRKTPTWGIYTRPNEYKGEAPVSGLRMKLI